MVNVTILEGEIGDIFWPEIISAMIYVRNLLPTYALKDNISPTDMQNHALLDVLLSTFLAPIYTYSCTKKNEA